MSLTYTAYATRKLIKFGGIFVVGFTVTWMLASAGISAYKKAHPAYVPPDVKYGILSKIVFPDKKFDKKNFIEELANDAFPSYSDQAKVYIITRPDNTFLALEEDTKTAKEMGFNDDPVQISDGVYKFTNQTLNQTLTMNVLQGSFQMQYPYQNDQMLLNPTAMPAKDEAISAAKDYLTSAGKLPDDLNNGDNKVTYWKIGLNGLTSVSSLSEANIIKVDFFRQAMDNNLKVVSADVNSAQVSVLVSGSTVQGKRIVEVNYNYSEVDRELYSTYPIKTTAEAWADLKAGNYWPAADVSGSDVAIKNVYLAYFEPVTLTNYLQPIYVFEGDNNFTAYVSAVTDKYTK